MGDVTELFRDHISYLLDANDKFYGVRSDPGGHGCELGAEFWGDGSVYMDDFSGGELNTKQLEELIIAWLLLFSPEVLDRKIELKNISIRHSPENESYMLERPDGEAMEIKPEALEKLLSDYYNDNF